MTLKIFFHHISKINLLISISSTLLGKEKNLKLHLVSLASEWNLKFDLDEMLVVPVFLAVPTLYPDIILFLRFTKTVIIIELTYHCEENMSQWHEEKSQKCYPLFCSIRSNGWSI